MVRGYARLHRRWQSGDVVELAMDMPVRRVTANSKVEADAGRVALMRGPIIYCVEGIDNGGRVKNVCVPSSSRLTAEYRADLLGGVTVVRGPALRLYRTNAGTTEQERAELVAVPYYANANRGPAEMLVWLTETPEHAQAAPLPTIASRSRPSASHCWQNDTVDALNDQVEPSASDDTKVSRFTWWDHRGTQEWAEYDFGLPQKVSAVEVHWWDERRINAHCRVPESWRLLHKDGQRWKPLEDASEFGVKMDQYNRVTFRPVVTGGLRLEVQLQRGWSGGILQWRVQ